MARLIMVSNRVAVPSHDGANYAGGLAVAVRWLLKHNGGIWFGWSGTALVDEEINTRTIQQGGLSCVVTDLAAADYQEYYTGFAIRAEGPVGSVEAAQPDGRRRRRAVRRPVRAWPRCRTEPSRQHSKHL